MDRQHQELSLFTHDQFNLTDNLVLTVGLRYSHENKDLRRSERHGNDAPRLQQMEAADVRHHRLAPDGIVNFLDTVAGGASRR